VAKEEVIPTISVVDIRSLFSLFSGTKIVAPALILGYTLKKKKLRTVFISPFA